ncbi:MAG: PAS domain S-box protein [Anaerolineae bacterium]|nr:PAS domain S-box protein [Anaerolineae bacterium]
METPLRVLVLEDRPADAELVLYELKRSGYEFVHQRVDTQNAYCQAIQEPLDIILADFSLPQFNAMQALHILQEHNLDIPFIVVTGTISEEAAVETMKQGAADYLLKDRLSRLGQAVQRALHEKQLRDEKRISEAALRISEEKFSKAFRISPDAIAILRLSDGEYIEINQGFSDLTGYKPEDVIGKNGLSLTLWADLDENRGYFQNMREQGEINNMEGVFKKQDGSLWIGLISSRTIEVKSELFIISIIRDITARKRAELELQRAHHDLAEAYEATIEGWSRVLDLRDKETEGHTQRVTEMTLRLARALGVSDEELVHIRRGALLHDIGKMAISDSILQKPGPLGEDEWKAMRLHPEYAHQMLYPIVYLRPALDIPYCHHEHWDGSGYPRGLKGEEIPLAARIFAIVDVWDALLSNRPYRKGSTEEAVLAYIQKHAGAYFDPRLVESFIDLYNRGVFNDTQTSRMTRLSGRTSEIIE